MITSNARRVQTVQWLLRCTNRQARVPAIGNIASLHTTLTTPHPTRILPTSGADSSSAGIPFSFSGAGFLSAFHVGAARTLDAAGAFAGNIGQQGNCRNRSVTDGLDDDDVTSVGYADSGGPMLYGVSGGALVAAGVACRMDYDAMLQIQVEVLKGCAAGG